MAPMGWQVFAGLTVKDFRSAISFDVCLSNIWEFLFFDVGATLCGCPIFEGKPSVVAPIIFLPIWLLPSSTGLNVYVTVHGSGVQRLTDS